MTRQRREALTGYLWISPWLVGFAAFTVFPMLASLGLSFSRLRLGRDLQFVGLDNYIRAATADALFWPSLGRTFYFTALTVPLVIVVEFHVTPLSSEYFLSRLSRHSTRPLV